VTLAITGATGFVGQAVLDEAARRGLTVRALARRDQPPRDGVEWVRGDLSDGAALSALVTGCEAVLHIAGVINTPDPMGFHIGNVVGTEALVEAACAAGVRRLVFVSSLAAREPGLSAYGKSKRHAEEVVQTSGLDWTIVRPPAIYGPRDREILELFRAARWGVVPMPAGGRASILHVDDLARLLLILCGPTASLLEARTGRIYEPDDGREEGWSNVELARAIGAAVGRKVRVPQLSRRVLAAAARLDTLVRRGKAKLTPDRVGYMTHPDWVSRPARAVPPDLWRPRIPTPEGLKATARWYRKQGWL
jgi:UDP-glucose 4-epimerase